MKYISTRGSEAQKNFSETVLMGLACDEGLMIPTNYPKIDKENLEKLRNLNYQDLAMEIMSLYINDIPKNDLQTIISNSYNTNYFKTNEIVSMKKLNDGTFILGLSNGPTFAFKDIAMQFVGNTLDYILKNNNKKINILGATSGDTGSAAEYALKDKNNIKVFMLSPNEKMSFFQKSQMYMLKNKNIFNIAIKGVFDDCQDIVKDIQSDLDFKSKFNLTTVNSINWARILAQIVYYFKGYFQATKSNQELISFCVPCGNFGNVFAGYVAKKMGLPIERLLVSTNENDVLDVFFKTGIYNPSKSVLETSSPSMDISKASNLERYIYELLDHNSNMIKKLWHNLSMGLNINLSDKLNIIHNQDGFFSDSSSHEDRLKTIKKVYKEDHLIIDPHTADGITVSRKLRREKENIICLETALPIKFQQTIKEALPNEKIKFDIPKYLANASASDFKFTVIDKNIEKVKNFIIKNN